MSCGVVVGLALVDLAMFAIAANATAVVVGAGIAGANRAAERQRLRQLIEEATGGEIDIDALLSEETEQEIHLMLEADDAGPEFQDAEVIVRSGGGDIIGLRRDSEGIYQVIAKYRPSDAQRLQVDTSDVAEKWRQRYAYLKVKREAEKLGYQVVEEEVLPDDSVRVRVRRWD